MSLIEVFKVLYTYLAQPPYSLYFFMIFCPALVTFDPAEIDGQQYIATLVQARDNISKDDYELFIWFRGS